MSNTILSQSLQGTYGTIYFVRNMQKAVDWYKALGLKPSYESDDWTEFSIDGHSLCLHTIDPNDKKSTSGLIILRVSNLKNIISDLKAKEVKILEDIGEVYPGSGAYRAKISDPEGNIISLYEGPLFSEPAPGCCS